MTYSDVMITWGPPPIENPGYNKGAQANSLPLHKMSTDKNSFGSAFRFEATITKFTEALVSPIAMTLSGVQYHCYEASLLLQS